MHEQIVTRSTTKRKWELKTLVEKRRLKMKTLEKRRSAILRDSVLFTQRLMDLSEKNILTKALILIKLCYQVYDKYNLYDGRGLSRIKKHDDNREHFMERFFPRLSQTKGCLIIRGFHGIPVSMIHTPYGQWEIRSPRNDICYQKDDIDRIYSEIFSHIECELLCPEYKTKDGSDGPYWLVKSIHGINCLTEVPDLGTLSLPTNCFGQEYPRLDSSGSDFDAKIQQYQELRCKFYKDANDCFISCDWNQFMFDTILYQWIERGWISDKSRCARSMLNDDHKFNQLKKKLSKKIMVSSDKLTSIFSGSKALVISKLIYYSEINDNDVSKICKYLKSVST